MPSRVSPFRPGGGLLTPAGPTRRPGRSAVGLGPVGREAERGLLPSWRPRGGDDGDEELSRPELAELDGWMKSRVGRGSAEAATATIRAARHFDDWGFKEWWSKHRNETDAIEKEACTRFFRRPFSGALVERTSRREIVGRVERDPWWDEPLVVRAYAEAGERTGFERPGEQPASDVPVSSTVPRLSHRVEELVRQSYLAPIADERLVQVWFVLTMRDVILFRGEPSRWSPVARREADLRSPALFQKVVWMIGGKWSSA